MKKLKGLENELDYVN